MAASHVFSRARWSRRDHERGFMVRAKFDATMPNNHSRHEPLLERDIAINKDVRRWMRNSYEATVRLKEASARRAEFESKVGRGRRVRFNMRLQVCGSSLGTFTVPWEDNPEASEWSIGEFRFCSHVPASATNTCVAKKIRGRSRISVTTSTAVYRYVAQ